MKPSDFVKDNNKAYFQFFRNGVLYYNVLHLTEAEYYQFQIPIEDLGNATVAHTEKALTLMRYIRKSIDNATMIKA